MHMFAAFYFVIILSLEQEWKFSYDELISLWTLGALLIGLGALPAGLLSDRWSRSSMMVIMFFGMGLSSILCGLSNEKFLLFIGLSFLGLSCSIYHPVGIAWVINATNKKGRALGINGIFGGVGIGSGAFIAGLLIKYFGWKFAFILPGIISLIIGVILLFFIFNSLISFENLKAKDLEEKNSSNDLIIIACIMLFSMFALGLTFQISQTSIPKVFDIRIENISTFDIGSIIGIIYGIAGLMTFIGGLMADKFSLKKIYVIGIAAQAPCYFFIAYFCFGVNAELGQTFNVFQSTSELKSSIGPFLIFLQSNVIQLSPGSQVSKANAASAASSIPLLNLASPVASI